MQQVLHLGGKTFKNANYHTTILGEQLVWKQEDPVQEEHCESSGCDKSDAVSYSHSYVLNTYLLT